LDDNLKHKRPVNGDPHHKRKWSFVVVVFHICASYT
jgi:hypothetical protein